MSLLNVFVNDYLTNNPRNSDMIIIIHKSIANFITQVDFKV